MKAIVIIDLPDDFDINTTCVTMDIVDKNDNWTTTAAKVRPIPQKFSTDGDDIEENSYWQGWNECLEEIEK